MRAEPVYVIEPRNAQVRPDGGAQVIGPLECVFPPAAECLGYVLEALFGCATPLGEFALAFGKQHSVQSGIAAQFRVDGDRPLDGSGVDRKGRLLRLQRIDGRGRRKGQQNEKQGAGADCHDCVRGPIYSAASCSWPRRRLSDCSSFSAASAITVPGGKIASAPAFFSVS